MTVTRKPMPSVDVPPRNQAPLPYPVSPTSPTHAFNHASSDQRRPPTSASQHQYLERPPIPQSRNSSVSDLSDGWVDGRYPDDHPAVSGIDLPSQGTVVPPMLQVGSRPGLPPRLPTPTGEAFTSTGLDALGEPQIPAPLRVTPPPSRSNNPFQQPHSSESKNRGNEHMEPSPSADIWANPASTPPRDSLSSTSHPGALAHPGSSNTQTAARQYRAYSPAPPANRPPHQTSTSMPMLNVQEDTYPVELPTSPSRQTGHSHSASDDVYSSLAELDSTLHKAGRPPIPTSQPPQESVLPETLSQSAPAVPLEKPPMPVQPQMRPLQPELTGTDLPMPVEEEEKSKVLAEIEMQPPPEPWLSEKEPLPSAVSTESETPMMRANRQRAETYQVKKIRWIDSVSPELRSTPIMVQNANGPCPLLALVNALTLSTPAGMETALLETLRSREQVTLGLLLDAVFDELMSGRRGNAAQDLPDVGELYSFLLALHMGMNVNPRFIPPKKESESLIDGFDTPRSPSYDGQQPPGGFEETQEMKLYSTFSIPLMHGWLPPRTHPAYAALKRSATTYEDAQNVLFREEDLEEKLRRQGLSAEEQQLLEDISTVKYFLQSSATQLTSYGLDVVTDSMSPGSIAILFRNDHFSTLYKHPRSGQLFSLVTDMGYVGHDEVVWESLVDVSGEACEFYSGDFRPVGFGSPRPSVSGAPSAATVPADEGGWTTVQRKRGSGALPAPGGSSGGRPFPPLIPDEEEYNLPPTRNTEQEDADLALAMQLQEEEEERQREANAQRQREEDASQAFLSQQGVAGDRTSSRRNQQNPLPNYISPQGNSNNSNSNSGGNRTVGNLSSPPPLSNSAPTPPTRRPPNPRPPVHRELSSGEDAPPPTYEQAARSTPYHGPVPSAGGAGGSGGSGSDSYAQMRASNGPSRDPYTRSRNMSAYSQHRASINQPPPNPGTARRRASGAAGILLEEGEVQRKEREREKDCIIM